MVCWGLCSRTSRGTSNHNNSTLLSFSPLNCLIIFKSNFTDIVSSWASVHAHSTVSNVTCHSILAPNFLWTIIKLFIPRYRWWRRGAIRAELDCVIVVSLMLLKCEKRFRAFFSSLGSVPAFVSHWHIRVSFQFLSIVRLSCGNWGEQRKRLINRRFSVFCAAFDRLGTR